MMSHIYPHEGEDHPEGLEGDVPSRSDRTVQVRHKLKSGSKGMVDTWRGEWEEGGRDAL